jgi:hypothetical protein
MTLYLSKFRKDAPEKTTEKIAELDFTFDAAKHCYFVEYDGIEIPGEGRMRLYVSCTDPQSYLSITVFQDGSNIINLVAALKNYAHAMVQFRSGYYLDIHVERERLQKAEG